jgi:uncharacterized protein DUF3300
MITQRNESARSAARRAALTMLLVMLGACDGGPDSAPQGAPPGQAAPAAAAPPAALAPAVLPPAVPAAVTQASWTPDALEELLAPIALYPDALLGQMLAASVNAQEVLDGGNWLLANQDLDAAALDAAALQVGFGPAMSALLHFPTVVDMMCQQIDWTRQLGSAFTSDQKSVLDAVQRLRAQAAEVGNLESTPQQAVETKQEQGKTIIEVKPADPMIVYVPQYNPTVIYTTPPPPPPVTTSTVVVQDDDSDEIAAGLLGFGAGILLAAALDDDCYPHWGYGAVYVGPRPFYPPAYVYRPVYGPAFRPAYGYAPPGGYRHNYKSGNNVVINNNDYYGRFSNNQNLRPATTNSPLGRSTYAGARNEATAGQLDRAAGVDNRAGQRPAGGAQTGNLATNRPEAGASATNRAQTTNRAQHTDRGYGSSTRTSPGARPSTGNLGTTPGPTQRPATTQRPAPQAPRPSTPTTPPRPTTPTARPTTSQTQNAFSGATQRGNGSFERSSSARGHASGGRAGGGGRRR